jgi:N4-gp56 family major capsid protein
MAATDFAALTDAVKRTWAGELWVAYRDNSFWFANGFIGASQKDFNKPIYRVTELTETERGLECVMQLVLDLEQDGTVGDAKLDDNEEALVNDSQIIKIDMLRHGVKNKGEMSEQATVIRFRSEAKEKLGFWLPDKLDELMFLTAAGRSYSLKPNGATRTNSQLPNLRFASDVAAPSTNRIKYAGSATGEDSLTSTDKMSWNLLINARQFAVRNGVKPIRDRGKDYYIVVLSPEQVRDLNLDPTYQTIVSRASEKGSSNPLFQNALATVGGLVLYEHRKVYNTTGLASGSKWGSGSTLDGAQAIMMGSQGLGFATIGNAFWRESDKTDYGNRPGIGYGRKVGILKPKFKSPSNSGAREDFGVIAIKTVASL